MAHTLRPDKTPTPQTYKDLFTAEKTPLARGVPLPTRTRETGMVTSSEQMTTRRAQTDSDGRNLVTRSEWPTLPSCATSTGAHVQRTKPPHHPGPVYQSWSNFQTKDDIRVKPPWIFGSPTPPHPPAGFALECPLGSYVLRHISDDRYGPASSSSSKPKDGEQPYEKVRPCFVTFIDGPFVYVAPMLGASDNSDHVHFKPFLSHRATWDWWLPVQWMLYIDAEGPPATPQHPSDRQALRGKESARGSMNYGQTAPAKSKQRPTVVVEWAKSPYPVKSSFIWSGDPGDRITGPDGGRRPSPQVRHIDATQIDHLGGWWQYLWHAKREPPRPKDEMLV